MSETDGEDGQVGLIELLHLGDDLHIIGGVAGTVGQHHAVIASGEHLGGRGVGGQDGHVAAARIQAEGHVALLAEIHRGDLVLGVLHREMLRLSGGHALHRAADAVGLQLLLHLIHIKMLRTGDHAVHAALVAEDLGQRTGVDALNAGDVVLFQIIVQRALAAEIAALLGELAHNKGLRPGTGGLIVLVVHTVIADEGIRHHNALPRIGRIGQDLLITHHRSVEHHLADPILGAADALANEGAAVFQDQSSFHLKNPAFPKVTPKCFFHTINARLRL